MTAKSIPVFIMNLKTRTYRRKFIISQFNKRDEFETHIVEAFNEAIGAIGLWKTIKHILRNSISEDEEFVVLCEDDHQFTTEYSKETLFKCIEKAKEKDTDILAGGVSGFSNALEVSNHHSSKKKM